MVGMRKGRKMPTPHNAAEHGDIAKVVLMPGDPLRAQFIAETYLEGAVQFNQVRNVFGYTGTYEGRRVSVMASGMGVPSMAIYSYELFHFYDVDTIIRIGTAGGLAPQVKVRDMVIAQATCTNSNFAAQFDLAGTIAPIADFDLLREAVDAAEERGFRYHVGNIFTTDVFYSDLERYRPWVSMGVLATEMEAVGLYLNAMAAGKRALAIATISDLPLSGESLSAKDRQTSFTQMMEVALSVAVREYDKSCE